MRRLIAVVVVGMLLLARAASAQIVTGTIIGTLKDESQGVLPGVSATLTSLALPGGPVTSVTSATGEYRFVALRPGVYTLTLALPGFATYQEQDLRVTANGTLERNVTLKVSALAETVTVSGEGPMVDVRQVAVTHTVPNELIENIQNQRYSIQEYAKWIPGVSAGDPSATSQTVSVMGSPSTENSWYIDGIITNNPTTGNSYQASDLDAVEEMQVSTLGASAEYAIAQGAVFNAIMKSGTNTFSGTGSYIFQSDRLVSKPTKLACNCPAGQTGFTRKGVKDYSFHVGGPIIKDRLWFFGGQVLWSRKESAPGVNPDLGLAWIKDNKTSTKVTWKISDRVKFSQVLNNEPFNSPGRPTVQVPSSALTDRHGHIVTYGSELTDQLSNLTMLTIRITGMGNPGIFGEPRTGDYTTPNHTDSQSGNQSGGVLQFYKQDLWRHAQSFKVNHYIQSAHVDQDIRGGVQLERAHYKEADAFPSGVQYQDLAGAADQAIFRNAWGQGSNYGWQSAWGEDQLTLGGRLTLSLGLRWDRMQAMSQDLPAVDNLLKPTGATVRGLGNLFTWKVVSPRLGFNLKLTDDGKTIVRGNYNRAYRAIFLADFSQVHPSISPSTLTRYDPATRGYTTTISVTNPIANIAVDPNIRAPFTDQYSIGLDRQLARNIAINVSYVYKHGQKQVGWKDQGGIYGTQDVLLADGRTLTVLPLLNSPSARKFVLTNGPGFFNTYHGLLMTLTKRLSNYWQANLSYTASKSEGLMPTAGSPVFGGAVVGQDPNDYINLAGRVATIDRPRMLTLQSTVEIAPIDVMVSASVMIESGLPYAPQALVQLPQGRRSINIAPPGTYRAPRQNVLALRFSKILARRANRKIELIANVNNALQSKAYQNYVTLNYFSPQFAQPSTWVEPRNMNLMAKVTW